MDTPKEPKEGAYLVSSDSSDSGPRAAKRSKGTGEGKRQKRVRQPSTQIEEARSGLSPRKRQAVKRKSCEEEERPGIEEEAWEEEEIQARSPTLVQQPLAPVAVVSSEPQTFTIVRELKSFAMFRSEELRMMDGDKNLFFTGTGKDNLGRFHIISTARSATLGGQDFQGIVRIHDSGERFTVISNEEKPNDDREAELAGVAFLKHAKAKLGSRALKLVLTANGNPNYPISKRWSLSRVAVSVIKGAALDRRFVIYDSSVFQGKTGGVPPETENAPIVKSCKNFLIRGTDGQMLFLLFKTAEGRFTMRCRYPVTPFIGFGLAVAIVTSKK
jgi:hypothetical protein